MRISQDRYSRDRLRFDLALRFIQHEARTGTIRLWTGLTHDRIRKLIRSYITIDGAEAVTRHRGKSPQQAAFFMRTPAMRQESAVLASVCYLLGVMPLSRGADAHRALPGVQRGEALCEAFEIYRRLVKSPHISFEHAVFLVTALARGDEISATQCSQCHGLIVVDHCALLEPHCHNCAESLQGR
jgi:hypothetical protein